MDHQAILDKLGALKDAATVQRVFGEPLTVGERTIIPVAEVRTGMGFGVSSEKKRGGEGEGGEKPEENDAGGGGGAMARPVGIVEVAPEGTSFIPIKAPVSPLACVFMGVALGMMLCHMKGKCHHGANNGG